MAQTQAQTQSNHGESQTDTQTGEREPDPSQLILPYIDSSMKIYKGMNVEELVLFAPAVAGAVLTVGALLAVGRPLAYLPLLATIGALSVGKWAVTSTESHEVPRERLRNRLAYKWLRRRLPWGHEEAMALPGLRKVGREGAIQRQDGRWLALVRLDELVADRMTDESIAGVVQALRRGIDTDLAGSWWGYYVTTRPSTSEDLASHREERSTTDEGLTDLQRDVLADSAAWLRAQDGWGADGDVSGDVTVADETAWRANETRHYIVVEAHRFEANTNPYGASLLAALPDGVRNALTQLPGIYETQSDETPDADEDGDKTDPDPDRDDTPTALSGVGALDAQTEALAAGDGRDVRDTLSARVRSVMDAVSEVSGVSARRAGRREHLDIAYAYWSGDDRHVPPHRLGDPLTRSFEQDIDGSGSSPLERMLAPERYDVVERTIQTGSRVSRSFWVAEWPMKPEGLFLRDLSARTGMDIDVKLYCDPYPDANEDLMHLVPEVDAERMDRMDRGDISSMSVEDIEEAYKLAFLILEHTNVSAWRLNGYLTVRADSVQELDSDCEELVRALKDHPGNCALVASGTRQHDQFVSGAPFGIDQYDGVTAQSKSRIALSGGLAAALSPVAPRIQE